MEQFTDETQYAFGRNRNTQDHIFTMRQIIKKAVQLERQIHVCVVDMKIVFDMIKREDILRTLKDYDKKILIECVKISYKNTENYIRVRNECSSSFAIR